jgi:class 3 adenylate cyclase
MPRHVRWASLCSRRTPKLGSCRRALGGLVVQQLGVGLEHPGDRVPLFLGQGRVPPFVKLIGDGLVVVFNSHEKIVARKSGQCAESNPDERLQTACRGVPSTTFKQVMNFRKYRLP